MHEYFQKIRTACSSENTSSLSVDNVKKKRSKASNKKVFSLFCCVCSLFHSCILSNLLFVKQVNKCDTFAEQEVNLRFLKATKNLIGSESSIEVADCSGPNPKRKRQHASKQTNSRKKVLWFLLYFFH